MKEFNFTLSNIYQGLYNTLSVSKLTPELGYCHNLEPNGVDYELHKVITDMNADGISWGGQGNFILDVWEDEQDDNWEDNSGDIWQDA